MKKRLFFVTVGLWREYDMETNLLFVTNKIFLSLLYLGEPEDVAAAIAFLASNDARYITGQTIVVDGGLTAHNPTVALS